MEIIARCVSSSTFRNAQENYSRSRHLFNTPRTHRDRSFLLLQRETRLIFYFLHYTFFFDILYREEEILVGGISPDGEYFIRKHSWPGIAVTLAETSTRLWTPFYGEWIVYFQARNRGRSRAAPVSILAFRLVPYFATPVVQRSV